MRIEIRNIKHYQELSAETPCYTAELHVNDVHVANVRNNGEGERTSIRAFKTTNRLLLHSANAYCEALPPQVLTGMTSPIPMNLRLYIDELFHQFLFNKRRNEVFFYLKDLSKEYLLYGRTHDIEQFKNGKACELLVGRITFGRKLVEFTPTSLRRKIDNIKQTRLKGDESFFNDFSFIDMLYEPLEEITAESDIATMFKKMALNFAELKKIDHQAKENCQHLYRYFTISVDTQRAYYQIIAIDNTEADVRICYGLNIINVECPQLGKQSTLPLYKAIDLIQSRDSLEDFFTQNKL